MTASCPRCLGTDFCPRCIGTYQLSSFEPKYMFWCPKVSKNIKMRLKGVDGLTLIVNEEYAQCIEKLKSRANVMATDIKNPSFRILQILEYKTVKPFYN